MSKFTRVWDEESQKFVFKSAEEAPAPNWGCVYGDYKMCEETDIEKTKAELLEQMIGTIRELAKKDEFWIVKKAYISDPLGVTAISIADPDKAYTVGWKAEFPQMMPENRVK